VVDDLWRAISENCDLRQSDAKIILETCLEMSSRKWGGLLILGDISKSRFSMETVRTCLGGSDSIESMGASILGQFAKMDGATMIDSRGIVQHVNTMVWVLEDPGELKHFKSRGARHKTAEKVSRLQPEALVVVISENGGISVLKAGEAKLIDY
jgi:DNA integrity scanning protein DisA with diadenylate cyclase activity